MTRSIFPYDQKTSRRQPVRFATSLVIRVVSSCSCPSSSYIAECEKGDSRITASAAAAAAAPTSAASRRTSHSAGNPIYHEIKSRHSVVPAFARSHPSYPSSVTTQATAIHKLYSTLVCIAAPSESQSQSPLQFASKTVLLAHSLSRLIYTTSPTTRRNSKALAVSNSHPLAQTYQFSSRILPRLSFSHNAP